ncbi:hypothetical protein BV898_04084 [Hypsibius exemplaris]|uniref:G-protein coupled receptors family 1 profile domain-containing protein n=1 Tax=Hypsibius exemplaris TaxID=2072580 RepID=A0A1W0X387_HYPEX|nr:hypothetical protein BV898_04084 [Hypsibius exemplaris]
MSILVYNSSRKLAPKPSRSITHPSHGINGSHTNRRCVFAVTELVEAIGGSLLLMLLHRQRRELRSFIDHLYVNLAGSTIIYSLLCCPVNAYTALTGPDNFLSTPAYASLCRSAGYASEYVFVTVGVAGAVGSVLLAILLCRQRRKLRSSVDHLFVNVAVTTIIYSLICCPLHAYTAIVGPSNFMAKPRYAGLCHTTIALHRFLVVVITVDRFRWIKSPACKVIFVAAPWLVAAVVLMFPLFELGSHYGFVIEFARCALFSTTSLVYFQFCQTFFSITALAANVVCYSAIVVKLILARRRQMRVVRRWQLRRLSRGQVERERAVTKTAFAMCLFFIVCAMPIRILSLMGRRIASMPSPLFYCFCFNRAVNKRKLRLVQSQV